MNPLAKFLMQAKGMTLEDLGRMGLGAVKGAAGAVRESPKAAALGGVGGLGAGYLLGGDNDPSEQELRRMEEERLLRELYGR